MSNPFLFFETEGPAARAWIDWCQLYAGYWRNVYEFWLGYWNDQKFR